MQITRNVTWQGEGDAVADVMSDHRSETAQLVLHHVVNLYQPVGADGLGADQVSTVESMRQARIVHPFLGGTAPIVHVGVHDEKDTPHIPSEFRSGRLLDRTIRDIPGFEGGPPFPLVFDILAAVIRDVEPAPTHIVLTNADICLQPYFYPFVERALSSGFDSLVINRRTVSHELQKQSLSIASADYGAQHPGLDCFVFPAAFLDSFVPNTACVGVGQVMRGLMHNLVAHATQLLVLTDVHLTFHFGDDRPWMSQELAAHTAHNRSQSASTCERLREDPLCSERLDDFFQAQPKYRPTT